MASEGSAGQPDTMTIDEIARAANLTARNVRAYQEKGLLHPPTKVGRSGYYDSSHLERLELIARLLDRGFSLAAIASLLESWHEGRSLAQVLGLEQALAASWEAEPVETVTMDELVDRLPGSTKAVRDSVAAGIIEEPGADGKVVARSPRALQLADVLHELGVPVDVLAAEARQLREDTDRIADRLVGYFVEFLWMPYVAGGRRSEDYEKLVRAIDTIRTMPADMVTTLLAHSLRSRLDSLAAQAALEFPAEDGDD